jgi:hypothetical protein
VTARGRTWRLLDASGRPFESARPGTLGGHRRSRIYGRLDCASARRAMARGGYVAERVFFADEATAIAAGYRPCATCLPDRYAAWKAARDLTPPPPAASAGQTTANDPESR